MGKLTKAKIDEIQRLDREGYTKKEIAEKVRVDRGTVAKYIDEKPNRGQGSPPDSELEILNREKKRLEAWIELETVKQKMLKVPNRLDDVETTLKAYGEDVERLRLKLKSQPDFSKLRCRKCGDYMAVDVTCVSCNQKWCFGLWAEEK